MNRYKLLVVHPGASWSTHDVYAGLWQALAGLGHEIVSYPLDRRIDRAARWLNAYHRDALAEGRELREPTPAEILFEANADVINRAAVAGVDGVLIISSMYTPLPILRALGWAHCPVGLVLTESPYDDAEQVKWAAEADVVWTNERTSVEAFRAVNPQSYYLPAAYDPALHTPEPQPGDDDLPAHDVIFVGTGFPERIALLEAVDWDGIDLGLYGNWMALADDSPLLPFVRGGVTDNATTAALYRRAKVGLNLYRTSRGFEGKGHIDRAESLNPRAYEMAACGIAQLSDWREELRDLPLATGTFDDGGLERRVCDLLAQPTDSDAALFVRPHTFAARAEQLMAQFAPALDRTLVAAYG